MTIRISTAVICDRCGITYPGVTAIAATSQTVKARRQAKALGWHIGYPNDFDVCIACLKNT